MTSTFLAPAHAAPVSNRVSVMGIAPYSQGVEAEIGVGGSPFRVGGQFIYLWSGRETDPWTPFTPQAGGRQQWNAWVGYRKNFSPDASIDVIGGMHQFWEEGISTSAPVIRHESVGIVGLGYEQTWSSVRLRLRPTFLVTAPDSLYLPWFGVVVKSALLGDFPWVEVGYRVMPKVELSVRTSFTPLALSLTF